MRKFYLATLILFALFLTAYNSLPKSKYRDFIFDYGILIKDIPPGASQIRLWVPYPAENSCQIIKNRIEDSNWQSSMTYDKKFKNKILYYSIKYPKCPSIRINLRYKIKRYEYSHIPTNISTQKDTCVDSEVKKYLLPSRLVTISPRVKELASGITQAKVTTMDKARALYDYVFQNVVYDKTIPGWGRGDTERVCVLKTGNCTDFHSLFISLARASGIPARFNIGVALPKKDNAWIKSYHCWAEFYVEGFGWVPVDISEAWKDKTKYEYYFGRLDENRIKFTHGRDIILEPPQNNEPLNYFIYPYVEIDDKAFDNVDVSFVLQDIDNAKGGEIVID
jgi:hypothetical protein